jgi:hypothetical protein
MLPQAQVEGATRVTHDRQFESYDIPIRWVSSVAVKRRGYSVGS